MKKIYFVLIFLALGLGCSSITENKKKLQDCIDLYESYSSFDSLAFPLGDHSEERYEADYAAAGDDWRRGRSIGRWRECSHRDPGGCAAMN